MAELKPYPKYKDSGIEWIGEIPEEWNLVKIKWLTSVKRGASPRPIDNPIYFDDEGEFSWVRISDVTKTKMYLNKTEQKLSELGSSLSVKLNPGNLILSIAASVGKPCINEIKCCIHDGFVYFPEYKGDIRYLFYIFESGAPYKGLGKMGTQLNLNTETVGSIVIPIPSKAVQILISDYLDVKTSQIDALFADKERLIELLEEKRQAVITETVTKGLDTNVKMKDSGIEWIGEIPEHWNITKIKYTTYVKGRIGWQGLKFDEFTTVGPHLVTGIDFVDGEVDWDSCHRISLERYNEAPEIQLEENDVLITKDGTIGKVAVVKNKPEKAILNSGVFVTRQLENIYLTEYMYWLLNSNIFTNFIDVMSSGTTVRHLYQDTFINFIYPLPNKKEQSAMVEYINAKVKSINNIISTIKKQITKLQEYRESLIYEAVTGKIDLRDRETDDETEIKDVNWEDYGKVAEVNESYQ